MIEKIEKNNEGQSEVLKRLGLNGREGENWDADTFYRSYVELEKELKGKDKLDKLTEFYADAFSKKKGRDETDYEDRYSMSPPVINKHVEWKPGMKFEGEEFIGGSNGALEDNVYSEEVMGQRMGHFESVQYGSSRIYKVDPNQFVFVPKSELGKNDVIGSSAFTSCTAVIVKTEQGVFYSHVTTDTVGVKNVVERLRELVGEDQEIHIVRPKWVDEGGKDAEYVEMNEARWQKTLGLLGPIKETSYPYITSGSKREGDIHETAILVANDTVRTVGYYISPKRRDFNPETAKDIQL